MDSHSPDAARDAGEPTLPASDLFEFGVWETFKGGSNPLPDGGDATTRSAPAGRGHPRPRPQGYGRHA
jgi:hypothetical protein